MTDLNAQPEMTVTNDAVSGNVVIHFPIPVAALSLPPANAIALAHVLLKRAGAPIEENPTHA